jgi:hypothetical protein
VSDDQSGYPGAPPGWYADPAGGPGQRWWDGYAWNEATIVPEAPLTPPPPVAGTPPPQWPNPSAPPWAMASERLASHNSAELVATEIRMVNIARFAVAMPAVYFLVGLINQRINATQLLATGRQFRRAYEAAKNGTTAPTVTAHSSFGPLTILVLVITLAAVVVACVWQHRAASAARALGLPATHSPAWGVGSWFVPVVNLWMPYQAIRDCLPPDDPRRVAVLQWWLVLMGTWVLTFLAEVVAFFSSGGGLAFSLPAALFSLGLLATAPRVVTAIAGAHQARSTVPG